MSSTVPLLYDSVSPNTGDIAMGIAGQQMLSALGVASAVMSPFGAALSAGAIIGGGELIRDLGDPFYDRFRLPGRHILNAAGVWTSASDLDYLKEYAFVSARSSREAEVIAPFVPDVEVLPCTTTMLKSEHYQIPGVEEGEPLVGIHVAPHAVRFIDDLVGVIDAIPHRKVLIPFTHYIDDKSFMAALPLQRSDTIRLPMLEPLQIHAVLRQMRYVLVTSLHASLFAYAQNVPFASISQRKVGYYFSDRGLGDHVLGTRDEVIEHLHRLEVEPPDYSDLIAADRAAVTDAYDRYASLLKNLAPTSAWEPTAPTDAGRAMTQEILLEQAHHVMRDRDLTILVLEQRRIALSQSLNALRSRLRNRIASRVGAIVGRFRG